MSNLYEEVKKLKDKFVSFQINHVLRVGKVDSAYVLLSLMLIFYLYDKCFHQYLTPSSF